MSKQPICTIAHAKINLHLEVVRRRKDGYHTIRTLYQAIELHDDVLVRPSDRLTVHCDAADVPDGEANSAWQAARARLDHAGIDEGADITIIKRIPVCSGLC